MVGSGVRAPGEEVGKRRTDAAFHVFDHSGCASGSRHGLDL